MKRYEKYKPSGVEWIGEIPWDWDVKRLKYGALINSATLPEKFVDDFLIDYIDISSVDSNGNISGYDELWFSQAPSRARRIVKKGDTIVSTVRTYLKAIAHIPFELENLVCSTGFAVLSPLLKQFYPKYLFYLCRSESFVDAISALSKGVSYPAIDSEDLKGIEIWLPALVEQTSIANYLDEKTAQIDALIEKKLKLIEFLKEERTAIINHAVTKGVDPKVKLKPSGIEWLGDIPEHWEVKKLKYVAEVVLGKMLTNDDKGGYSLKPYLRAANLLWFNVDVSDVKEMWFSDVELNKLHLKKYDLLVSEGGEVGRTCIWNNELDECYIQNSVHKITVVQSNEPKYFLYLFYGFGQRGFFDSIVNRISIAHLTGEKIKEIVVIVPPKAVQTAIVQHIEYHTIRIDTTISKINKEINLLQEYRTALISEVVTGKIKVI